MLSDNNRTSRHTFATRTMVVLRSALPALGAIAIAAGCSAQHEPFEEGSRLQDGSPPQRAMQAIVDIIAFDYTPGPLIAHIAQSTGEQ